MSHPNPLHDSENVLPEDIDYTKKALDIIQNEGVGEWLKVRREINLSAINNGYCVDIEGCCEEDRCDCHKYIGLTLEEAEKKLLDNK